MKEAFEKSKLTILKAVEKGVRTYDMGKITYLACDWNKTGIGFTLQKECTCTDITPVC